MSRKLKLALVALLGFSGACSSVKNAPKSSDLQSSSEDLAVKGDTLRRIVVMYGIPNPRNVKVVESPELLEKQDSLRKPVNRHPAHFEVDPATQTTKD